MFYHGYCDKQNRNYTVEIEDINASATEDSKRENINGRFNCDYSGLVGCCRGPQECSIVKKFIR